jgi:hypothetical protein
MIPRFPVRYYRLLNGEIISPLVIRADGGLGGHSRRTGRGKMAPEQYDPGERLARSVTNVGRSAAVRGFPGLTPRSAACLLRTGRQSRTGISAGPLVAVRNPAWRSVAQRAPSGKYRPARIIRVRLDLILASFMQCSHASHSADTPRRRKPPARPRSVHHRRPRLLRPCRPGVRATQEESMAARRPRRSGTSGSRLSAYIHTPRRRPPMAAPTPIAW